MNKKIIVWLVAAAVILIGAYLILGPSGTTSPSEKTDSSTAPVTAPVSSKPSSPSGGLVQVDIKGFAFVGSTVRIAPGTTIMWKNSDDAPHSVVGANFQSKILKKGESFSYTFTQEGSYPYYCGLHSNMKGEIVVRGGNF